MGKERLEKSCWWQFGGCGDLNNTLAESAFRHDDIKWFNIIKSREENTCEFILASSLVDNVQMSALAHKTNPKKTPLFSKSDHIALLIIHLLEFSSLKTLFHYTCLLLCYYYYGISAVLEKCSKVRVGVKNYK